MKAGPDGPAQEIKAQNMCRVLGPEQSEFIHPTKLRFIDVKIIRMAGISKSGNELHSEAEGRPKGDGVSYASGGRDEKKAVLRPPGGDRDGARSAMSVGREPRG